MKFDFVATPSFEALRLPVLRAKKFGPPSLHLARAIGILTMKQLISGTPEINSAQAKPDPLDILFERSCILADRVREGTLQFIEGVDMAYSAAELSGLIDRFGDDVVQLVLADAFTGAQS